VLPAICDVQDDEHQMFYGGPLGDLGGGGTLGDLGAFTDIAESSFSFGCFA
jgi:hypothetical protein